MDRIRTIVCRARLCGFLNYGEPSEAIDARKGELELKIALTGFYGQLVTCVLCLRVAEGITERAELEPL